MNKKQVNDWMLPAKNTIEKLGISENGKVDSNFRSHISSFGAAVVMGSLKPTVAFFANDGSSKVPRSKLIVAMYYIITGKEIGEDIVEPKDVFDYVCKNDTRQTKERFINASIALKLALNFFDMGKGDNDKNIKDGED